MSEYVREVCAVIMKEDADRLLLLRGGDIVRSCVSGVHLGQLYRPFSTAFFIACAQYSFIPIGQT